MTKDTLMGLQRTKDWARTTQGPQKVNTLAKEIFNILKLFICSISRNKKKKKRKITKSSGRIREGNRERSREKTKIRHWKSHSHKKRKDSLEMRAVLLIFALEIEISGVVVQKIHQNSKKCRLLHSENDFEAVLANFFYDCAQIKKIITNAPRVL